MDLADHRHRLAVVLGDAHRHVGFLDVHLQLCRELGFELLERHAGRVQAPHHRQLEIAVGIQALRLGADVGDVDHLNQDLIVWSKDVCGSDGRVTITGGGRLRRRLDGRVRKHRAPQDQRGRQQQQTLSIDHVRLFQSSLLRE